METPHEFEKLLKLRPIVEFLSLYGLIPSKQQYVELGGNQEEFKMALTQFKEIWKNINAQIKEVPE